jgi:N utilization substance protein B
MANRHLSRSIVLQTLFEWDFNGKPDNTLESILERNVEEFAPGTSDSEFMRTLAVNIAARTKTLDDIIEKAAPAWPIDRIAAVDRNILRLGLFELLFADRLEVPPKVAINEAIELAKSFGGDNSGKFVNGVLGAVYKELGEPGKDETSKHKHGKEPIDLEKLPIDKLIGAIVYGWGGGILQLAFVHDIFGHWTLAKGHLKEGETDEEAVNRKTQEELGIPVTVKEKIGDNEYLASDPEKGKLRKQVCYYLAESPVIELTTEKAGGLDDSRWFPVTEVPSLNLYDDIVPIITKAIGVLLKK